MKVGIVAWPMDEENKGGIGYFVENVVEQLIRLGLGDEIVLIRSRNSIEHVSRQIVLPTPGSGLFKRTMQRLFGLPAALNSCDIDVAYFPYYYPMLYGGAVFTKSKKVLTIHDLVPLLYPETQPSLIEAKIWTLHMKKLVHSFAFLTADSESTKRDIVEHFNVSEERVRVIYPGCNPLFRQVTDRSEKSKMRAMLESRFGFSGPFLLFVGTLEPRKNVERVLRAFAILKSLGYPHKLVLVGKKGWKCESVFRTISGLQLSEDVIWAGYAKTEEMVALYNLADVFVFPSLYEGFGLPPLEAMACGTPVVVSNISSLPEVVGDAGLVVDPLSEEDIAEAILRIVDDAGLAHYLSEKGVMRAKQFSWQRTAEALWEIFRELPTY